MGVTDNISSNDLIKLALKSGMPHEILAEIQMAFSDLREFKAMLLASMALSCGMTTGKVTMDEVTNDTKMAFIKS